MMEQVQKQSMDFIKTDLIPEMVQNRCFCESGSREFVQLVSVCCEPMPRDSCSIVDDKNCGFYRAQVVIEFSGQPTTFYVIVKLLLEHDDIAYGRFLNEEIFYSKMTVDYRLNIYPKCFVADMGRYGRPVIVLEDLAATGYLPVASPLNSQQTKISLKAITGFLSRGFELKRDSFTLFREFYSKLIKTLDDDDESNDFIAKIKEKLQSNQSPDIIKILSRVPEDLDDQFKTICHGNLTADCLMFRYENDEPVDVKILGWNQMRYTYAGVDLQFIIKPECKLSLKYDRELIEKLLYCYPYIQLKEIEELCCN